MIDLTLTEFEGLTQKEQVALIQAFSAGKYNVLVATSVAGLPLADLIAGRARQVAEAQLAGRVAVEVILFGRKGEILGRSPV